MKGRRAAGGVLFLLALGSCSGEAGNSPEGVFESCNRAIEKRDWRAFYAHCDPMYVNGLSMGAMMALAFATKDNEELKLRYDALLKRHGIVQKSPQATGEADKSLLVLLEEKFKDVKDRPGLYSDLMTFLEQALPKEKFKLPVEGTLIEVKTDGDRASGTVQTTKGEKRRIQFRRRNGVWYLGGV